ncbi:MAG: hypothetical protein RR553_08105 [Akkermansia sp.]
MSDIPMYSGASAQLGGGANPLEAPAFGLEMTHKAIQRGASAVDGVVQQFMKIQDSAPINFNEANARECLANLDVELEQRLALAPGANGALFDERGDLIKGDFDDLVRMHTQKIDDYRPTYMMPESQMQADRLKADVIQSMQLRAMGHVARGVTANARRAYEGNLKLAYEQGDYEGVKQINNRVAESGVISGVERDTGNAKADKVREEERIKDEQKQQEQNEKAEIQELIKMSRENPVALIEKLNTGGTRYLNEEKAERFVNSYLSEYRKARASDVQEDFKNGKLTPQGIVKAKDMGFVTDRDAVYMLFQANGRTREIYPKMQSDANAEALLAPAPTLEDGKPNPAFADWEGRFRQKWSGLRLESSYINSIVEEKKNVDPDKPDYDIEGLLKLVGDRGELNKNYSPFDAAGNELKKSDWKMASFDEDGNPVSFKKGDDPANKLVLVSQQERFENADTVRTKFKEWRKSIHGRMATQAQQDDFVRKAIRDVNGGRYPSHVTKRISNENKGKTAFNDDIDNDETKKRVSEFLQGEEKKSVEAGMEYRKRSIVGNFNHSTVSTVRSRGVLVSLDDAEKFASSADASFSKGVKSEDFLTGAEIEMQTPEGNSIKTRIIGVDENLMPGQVSFGLDEASRIGRTKYDAPAIKSSRIFIPKERKLPEGFKETHIKNLYGDSGVLPPWINKEGVTSADADLMPVEDAVPVVDSGVSVQ